MGRSLLGNAMICGYWGPCTQLKLKPSLAGPASQFNPVQTMRPFLIPGTVSFAPDTGTPAFETVGTSTVSFPGHTVPEGNETVPLIRNAVLANTWSRAFETVTVQEIRFLVSRGIGEGHSPRRWYRCFESLRRRSPDPQDHDQACSCLADS